MQVGLVARKRAIEAEESGIAHAVDGELVDRFLGALPFELTGDQVAAIAAIRSDMAAHGADASAAAGRGGFGQDARWRSPRC